ncbi:hypothetical protein GQ53DRAFT_819339 [Thozetella sp. PMI_491]|nr:hypothetical protein GQ53DRAFT_819339 [Thozetella sp. PMI_491]
MVISTICRLSLVGLALNLAAPALACVQFTATYYVQSGYIASTIKDNGNAGYGGSFTPGTGNVYLEYPGGSGSFHADSTSTVDLIEYTSFQWGC